MAAVAVAAMPQMLGVEVRWLWPPWPRCRKCWRVGRGGQGRCAANAGVEAAVAVAAAPYAGAVAAVVVAAVAEIHIWYAHPSPYDGVAFVRLPKVHRVFIHARICLRAHHPPD